MSEEVPKSGEKKPQTKARLFQGPWLWWIVFAGFILWDFVLLKPSPHPEVGIPYSTFLAEVRDGNVNSVHIVGAAITGAFAKPVQWPPPTPTAALQSESHAPPSAKPAQPAAPAPKFTAFETTFPEAIGDSGLMPLLAVASCGDRGFAYEHALALRGAHRMGSHVAAGRVFLVDEPQRYSHSSRHVRLRALEGSPLFE